MVKKILKTTFDRLETMIFISKHVFYTLIQLLKKYLEIQIITTLCR